MNAPNVTVVEGRRYLVKGCAPEIFFEGQEYPVDNEGPLHQRQWMVADAVKDNFCTQRHPGFQGLATIRPRLENGVLHLHKDDQALQVPFDFSDGEQLRAKVWDCEFDAVVHPEGSRWISEMIKRQCRLVRKVGGRLINRPQFAPPETTANLSDRFHLLGISVATFQRLQACMDAPLPLEELFARLRPDLILTGCDMQAENRMVSARIGTVQVAGVKPCERCTVPDVDQDLGQTVDNRVTDALDRHFKHPNRHTIFGENFLVSQPGVITIGEQVQVEEWREQGWNRPY